MPEQIRQSTILCVDDDTVSLLAVSQLLKDAGLADVVAFDDSRRIMPYLAGNHASVILLDLKMPFVSGQELLGQIHRDYPEIPLIIMTAVDDLQTAVECMKMGASDYLLKPVENSRLISSVQKLLDIATLQNEISSLRQYLASDRLHHPEAFCHIVTSSRKMLGILQYVEAIAPTPFPVLVCGETGVGKELVARSIHLASRPGKPFVAVNVAGLDDNMFSDTLFGHKKGAFTGAESHREGLVATAQDGTLFLDEIGDLSGPSQVKLLRLIQEREYFQLGTDQPRKTAARIVCSTNHPLSSLMEEGSFRKDLYYRLKIHQIDIPPLRDRPEDIPVLTDHFIREAAGSLKKKPPFYPPELVPLLQAYDYPGNVRELQAMLFDAVSRHKKGILSLETFRAALGSSRIQPRTLEQDEKAAAPFPVFSEGMPTLGEAEEYLITRALQKAGGNQGIAAHYLGISRQALNKRLNRKKNRD